MVFRRKKWTDPFDNPDLRAEMPAYNDDEIAMIRRIAKYGLRGVAQFASAEGFSITPEMAKNLVPAKNGSGIEHPN